MTSFLSTAAAPGNRSVRSGSGWLGTVVFILGILVPPAFVSTPSYGRRDFLDTIEKYLETGRNRQALTELRILSHHQGLEGEEVSARFLLLEARAFLANGYVEEARQELERLKSRPNWEEEVSPEKVLATEMSVLKVLGRSVEALSLLETNLPYLDEIDPPYPPDVTEIYEVYADLLFTCSQYEKAADTVVDLLLHGDNRSKPSLAQRLLDFADGEILTNRQWKKIPETLDQVPNTFLWHRFAAAAFRVGKPVRARELLDRGMEQSLLTLRALWPRFVKETDDEGFLKLAADLFRERLETESGSPPSEIDRLGALEAFTLEKLGQYDEALEVMESLGAGDLDLRFLKARVYAAQGRIEEASRIYAHLEEEHPGMFLEPWGEFLADHGHTKSALEVWARIPEKGGKRIEQYRRWGNLLKERGFLEEAKEAFMEGIRRTNRPVFFAPELLSVSLALGDVEGTLTAYQSQRGLSDRHRGIWSPERLVQQLIRTQQAESFAESLDRILEASRTVRVGWRDFAVELETELVLKLNKQEILRKWLEHPPLALQAYWKGEKGRKYYHLSEIGMELAMRGEDRLASEVFGRLDGKSLAGHPLTLLSAARSHRRIGDTTQALEYYRMVWDSTAARPSQKQRAALSITEIHLKRFQPGEALEWLRKIEKNTQPAAVLPDYFFLKGLAYTQLHEKRRAVPLLQNVVDLGKNRSAEALYWLAEWALWQRDREEALEMYREILSHDPGQDLANETLWRLRHLAELEEDQLPLYSMAAFFEAGGDFEEAEKNYRKLAARMGPSDLTDWVYYRIGKMLIESGNREEGIRQWRVLLEKTESATLKERVEFEMASVRDENDGKSFEEIMMKAPNTLLGDLAREKFMETSSPSENRSESQMVP